MKKKTIFDSFENRRILVTCGTGGVGKTTVSASLGVRAAMAGKKVVVITIDPAKRLATSLGVERLGHEPVDLTEKLAAAAGVAIPGKLFAVMPKSRESFERLIRSLTTSEAAITRIFKNPILATFSEDFSGANEYLALEELAYFRERNEYDLIILDTPPSRNTLSFLEAPKLLARFFEERFIRFLVLPANRLLAAGMRKAFSILERLTGAGFMNQLFDFGEALFEVQDGFLKKLQNINRLLQSEEVGFLLVAAPTPESAPELGHFLEQIDERGFHFDGVLLNRSLTHLKSGTSPEAPGTPEALISAIIAREELAYRRLRASAEQSAKPGKKGAKPPELFASSIKVIHPDGRHPDGRHRPGNRQKKWRGLFSP